MNVLFGVKCLFGVAWLAKGVVNLMRGYGADYWGDDFVCGGVFLVVGVLGWLHVKRQARWRVTRSA